MLKHVDYIIIGQGLAGTALGWTLLRRGYQVLILDRCEQNTSSQIAAGLITPITGLRLVVSWRLDEFLPFATDYYRNIEQQTGSTLFELKPMLRLFSSEQEQEQFQQRSLTHFPHLISEPKPLVDHSSFEISQGGFEMNSGAQLDVPTYLSSSQQYFIEQNSFLEADVNSLNDFEFAAEKVILPRWNLAAPKVIFCEGIHGRKNHWFQSVPFEGAKGEILTLKIPGLTRTTGRASWVWLAHWKEDLYRAGSTYDREHLDTIPTEEGRAEICTRLSEFLKLPVEVIDHRAAVRPVIRGRLPIMGLHPTQPQLGFFNGFASKGSLQTPWMADYFVNVLEGKGCLEKQFDLSRRIDPGS